jgi:hypothetical protein
MQWWKYGLERTCYMHEFTPFPKIARLKREAVVTEKIDGTNAAICITDSGEVYAQSRNRVITTSADNHGFANWVENNKEELLIQLGPGIHFGEWWGAGVQKRYNISDKRFSLFNVHRWHTETSDCRCVEAPLCFVVPTLAVIAKFSTEEVDKVMQKLKETGSIAAPGCMNPEGIVVFHSQNSALYKVTYEYDEEGKNGLGV